MDRGKYLTHRILNLKKGVWDTTSKHKEEIPEYDKIIHGELEFKIECSGKNLEVFVFPRDLNEWETLKDYIHLMENPYFYQEIGFTKNKFQREWLQNLQRREYSIIEEEKAIKISAELLTGNDQKAAESIFYAIMAPMRGFRNFSE